MIDPLCSRHTTAFADQTIRAHAVQRLEEMGDDKLLSYLLQLVQVCFGGSEQGRTLSVIFSS